jgi:integrase
MQKLVEKLADKINLFEQSIRSEYTRKVYTHCLLKYFQYTGVKKLGSDPRKIEDNIINFVISMKKQGKTFSAINNYVSAICRYYRTQRVHLDTKNIHQYLPEFKKSRKNREYKHEEIQRLLDVADERMRAVILLLASSGIRIGSIPALRLRNIEKVTTESELSIYKIIVYEGFNEEYVTFCSVECTTAIDSYLKMREQYGEKLLPSSYLIREQFDVRDPFKISRCKEVKSSTITKKLTDLAERSLIRQKEVLMKGKIRSTIRKDVPIAHGFRKFFSSQLVEADVKTELRWLLEGHALKGNDSNYVRVSEKSLLQEYEKGIDNLTIDPANRLQRTVEILKIEKSQLELITQDIQELKRKMKRKYR